MDAMLALVDLKFLLLLWILLDLYRNTVLLGDLAKKAQVAKALLFVWDSCGSPYLIWIPIAAVADIFVKRMVKAGLE
jgi:hypothetical protein